KTWRLALDHFGQRAARHHLSRAESRAIGCAPHPRAVGGIERDVARAQQHLAILGRRHRALAEAKDFGPELALGQMVEDELAIAGHDGLLFESNSGSSGERAWAGRRRARGRTAG